MSGFSRPLLLLAACRGPGADTGALQPSVSELEQVVPGDGLPAEVEPQTSNNNLDVVEHQGEVFLAFRTAPSHFAGTDTVLYVVRSADQRTWSFETSFAMGTDLREPRLLSWDGRLWLYFAVLGEDPLDFEPQGAMVSERTGAGQWTEPQWLFEDDGFIPWRTRVVDGVPQMLGYTGGEDVYDTDGMPAIEIKWLTTTDGLDWQPFVPGQAVVSSGGGSETDGAFLPDGRFVAVVRNEAGDELGWGSKICVAEPGALGSWSCAADVRKYDSPLVFEHGGRIWLIGRRHLENDGAYDLQLRDMSHAEQTLAYQAAYWPAPKRCSLWEVHADSRSVDFVLDLPSRGDTCFASALDEGEGVFRVYNYSSDVDGPDVDWIDGQLGPTSIYRQRLELP